MIIVHHLENSRSQRLLWLLEELKLDYEIKRYERAKDMSAPDSLRKVHPLGKSPILEEGEVTWVESGAILEHLAEAHARFGRPESVDEARRFTQFLHYAEGSLLPPMFVLLVVMKLGILGLPARKPMKRRIEEHLDYVEHELEGRTWFADERLTIADMMMSFPLEAAQARGLLGEARPNIEAWLKRCHERPAYQRALERGGDYAYAG
ncbi:glutathione S-transferase family protein [Sphingomicrobium nitratireducens]|uniref:glutathione S-transferase family protein n=1 Tax=Sphingomicrobium nitratireducens TaxID=2964666 RepID=UPI00223FB605|nr:glutathione S-transferase [Sphingomicrobium nitratireducens]